MGGRVERLGHGVNVRAAGPGAGAAWGRERGGRAQLGLLK